MTKRVFTEMDREIQQLVENVEDVFGDHGVLRLLELLIAYTPVRTYIEFYEHAINITELCEREVLRENKNSEAHFEAAKDLYFRNSVLDKCGLPKEKTKRRWDKYR